MTTIALKSRSLLSTAFPWLFGSNLNDDDPMISAGSIQKFVSAPLKAAAPPPPVSISDEIQAIQANKPKNLIEFEEFESYVKLADEIGLSDNPDLVTKLFSSFCAANDIPIYDFEHVESFMDKIIVAERRAKKNSFLFWFWRPLTKDDGNGFLPSSSGMSLTEKGVSFRDQNAYRSGQFEGRQYNYDFHLHGVPMHAPYNKAIPRYILERAKKVIQQFGKDSRRAVSISVSDYDVANPDPFLLVTLRGQKFVIGVWDEPSYK